jgi:L-fuculose-phosphate aldolase
MTATGKSKCDVTEDWIAILDEEGKQVDGIYTPTSEFPMHTATYKMRSDINAVIHAHCNFLAAYAICNKPIKTEAYPEMMILFKEIPVVPYGRPGTDEIYKELPKYIEKFDVVLLANHGVLLFLVDIMRKLALRKN